MSEDRTKHPTDPAARLSDLRSGGAKKPAKVEAEHEPAEAEEFSDAREESFSTLSAARMQKMMLELRFKTQDAEAFPYSFLVRASFNKSKGILLDFSLAKVRIFGRNLRPLFSAIVAQRAAVVKETEELHAEADFKADATVVTRIELQEEKEDEESEE